MSRSNFRYQAHPAVRPFRRVGGIIIMLIILAGLVVVLTAGPLPGMYAPTY